MDGLSGGALCRVPADRTPPGVIEGGAAEMETGETNEDLGDGGGGYGLSGGALCRGPAARAPPGVVEGGAAEMETAVETAPQQHTGTAGKKKKKKRMRGGKQSRMGGNAKETHRKTRDARS